MHRRTYLKTAVAAAAGATIPLAGCSTAVGEVPPPSFPESEMGGWKRIDERRETLLEREVAGRTVTVKAHGVAYGDAELRREVERFVGSIDHPVSLLAASRIEASLDLDELVAPDSDLVARVEKRARQRFESRLASIGVRNLQRTEAGEVTVDTGETARAFRYVADLALGEAGGRDLGTIPVAADLLVWRHDGALLVAGGAYPATALTEALGNHVPDTADPDFDPESYREEVRDVLTGIE